MWHALEDYALIGDTHTVALVHRSGSIAWLCLPDVDSDACFASLLGRPEHGQWTLAPNDHARPRRRYYSDSLVLETTFECDGGDVQVIDCMPVHDRSNNVIRQVRGLRGTVTMRSELRPRFAYGSNFPWILRQGHRLEAVAGPDVLTLDSDVEFVADAAGDPCAEFRVGRGDVVNLCLAHGDRDDSSAYIDVTAAIHKTTEWWRDWVADCSYTGEYWDAVVRSLVTLKALTFAPTGGIVAAATTSLPEQIGGVRNWDYRYCWIRDATFSLLALLQAGYEKEARAWREWLLTHPKKRRASSSVGRRAVSS